MTRSYQHILLAIEDGVATLTLNRPGSLNSFTVEMHEELAEALTVVSSDDAVRVLVLTGAGRGFCAGQDLSLVPDDLGEVLERYYGPLVTRLRELPKPVIAAVNGVAAGAGANLALACDLVIAARSASFIQAFSKIGLLPDAGGTYFLPRQVGSARAMGLALLADKLPAQQAADWGLIWQCVDDEAFAATVQDTARRLADGPTLAYARIKQALQVSAGNTLQAQLVIERDYQRELGQSTDFAEGVAAFNGKRAPRFVGH
ncbi:2-(1,2-epoxy-1,2-dihydrophenyl)acetyl-CoA isomerase PaaG [Crenobacter sp. SG2303]|uniref:2-(1,2-epoxy-1,2-dihydrophenyl)acetyl-CoA isomerase PaaG n=1 Tax=Crenobacter oryzisoli TaxID=3056844 RepID=A0ABT7XV32_9NEIS|nr:2-(1,2-epoxy-1,2-dihydrophenyl)acetyl-CoA isomerase PaaG [Crenobacter sp. SG2303]MDN0077657.1 2-(1,2-epoxy-1,2-dihydrophenyl)acetyl-CoA isomerase PaaG [Crenobacter sp. SG2303]